MGATSHPALAAQMRKRAAAVRRDGVYVGFFEWLLFARLSSMRVHALFGRSVVDLISWFAPKLPELTALTCHPLGFVAVVVAGADPMLEAHYDAAGRPYMSHFVLGVPLGCADKAEAAASPSASASTGPPFGTAAASASGVAAARAPRCAHAPALEAGFALRATAADGNCGPHTMTLLQGLAGTAGQRQAMRYELGRHMEEVADDPHWQYAWRACQEEYPAKEPEGECGTERPSRRTGRRGLRLWCGARRRPVAAGGSGLSAAASAPVGGLGPPPASGMLLGGRRAADLAGCEARRASSPEAAPTPAPRHRPAPDVTPSDSAGGSPSPQLQAPSTPASEPIEETEEARRALDFGDEAEGALAGSAPAAAGAELAADGQRGDSKGALQPPRRSFLEYFESLDEPERHAACASYKAYLTCQEKWLRLNPPAAKRHRALGAMKQRTAVAIRHKIALGAGFLAWRSTPAGSQAKNYLRAYCRTLRPYQDGVVPDRDRVNLSRAVKLVTSIRAGRTRDPLQGRRTHVKPSNAEYQTPARRLERLRGKQGRPRYGGPLAECLWDWFADVRGSVATVLPPKFLRMKAMSIAQDIVRAMRKTGQSIRMPRLQGQAGTSWLHRWCRDHGVVLRAPNRRFKASFAVLGRRLKAMWRNNIVLRTLAQE